MKLGGNSLTDEERALLPPYAPRPARPALTTPFDDSPVRCLHVNEFWYPHLAGVISALDEPDAWTGTQGEIDFVRSEVRRLLASLKGSCVILGSIHPYAGNVSDLPPWALICDGTTYERADYPDLYEILDSAFVISGTQFKTPELSGRFPLSSGNGHSVGDVGGSETHTLTTGEMPTHAHTYYQFTFGVDIESVGVPDPTGVGQPALPDSTSSEGGGQSHNNMPPFITLRYYMVARYP